MLIDSPTDSGSLDVIFIVNFLEQLDHVLKVLIFRELLYWDLLAITS
jgi:hypothetical protein